MTTKFENRINVNNALIAEQKSIIAVQDDVLKQYRRSEITWDEYYERAFSRAGYNIKQSAEDFADDLELWNAILNGDKMFLNGSYYSDIQPYEIVEILTSGKVVIRPMKCTCVGEAYGNEWKIESDPNAAVEYACIRATSKGVSVYRDGDKHYKFNISKEPYKYYDYSF